MIRSLYFWVLIFIIFGIAFGAFFPDDAKGLKWIGDSYISGIKILVGPLIFTTISLGISRTGGGKKAARVGLKAFIYFELVSTLALMMGLFVANVFKPGMGFPIDPSRLDPSLIDRYTSPKGSIINPFQGGVNLVQILILGIFSGVGLVFSPVGFKNRLDSVLNKVQRLGFKAISKYLWFSPIGAGSAIAFTVGHFGLESLSPLWGLMLSFYLTCILFVFGVLGLILRSIGVPVIRFISYLKEEILLVFGTSSSESALAPLMSKLERLGCHPGVVGLVVPTGYSLNLDGTNIYLTLTILFIAQAFGVPLSISSQFAILLFAMVTSKGASGVTGAGFITLAATLSVVPEVPITGLVLVLGIDRFMSEARAVTNMIGNAVGALVISRWEGALNAEVIHRTLQVRRGIK